MTRSLYDLIQVSQIVLDAELSELRSHSAKVDAIRNALAVLAAEKTAVFETGAHLDAKTTHWLAWVAGRQQVLNGDLAIALAKREQQKRRAERAFGRAEATRALADRNKQARRKISIQRAGVST